MTDLSTIDPKVKSSLLKKWKTIHTKYSKLRDNWFMKVSVKWNTIITKDFNKTKQYYLNKIDQAEKLIKELSQTI